MVDLTESTINTRLQVNVDNILVVPKEFAGKPTAIAYSVYGSENFADLLFAFNGYSNMLRVNEGDILVIPNLQSMIACLTDPEDVKALDISAKTGLDSYTMMEFKKNIVNRDVNRLKVISQNTGIDINLLDIRKPNTSTSEDSFTKNVEESSIVLGTNITDSTCKTLTPTQTKSELIRDSVREQLITRFAEARGRFSGKLSYKSKTATLE